MTKIPGTFEVTRDSRDFSSIDIHGTVSTGETKKKNLRSLIKFSRSISSLAVPRKNDMKFLWKLSDRFPRLNWSRMEYAQFSAFLSGAEEKDKRVAWLLPRDIECDRTAAAASASPPPSMKTFTISVGKLLSTTQPLRFYDWRKNRRK